MDNNVEYMTCLNQVIDRIIQHAGPHIKMAMPLGLGKAHLIVNGLYAKVKQDPHLKLTLYTALTLSRPRVSDPYAAQVMESVVKRLYGEYPDLAYATDRSDECLPFNINVYEFFLSPGALLHNANAQQHYLNSNYTHAARDIYAQNINVILQMVAEPKHGQISLSCNPDVTLDLEILVSQKSSKSTQRPLVVGEVNSALPYLKGQAEVSEQFFDIIYTNPVKESYQLFTLPQRPVKNIDYALAMHVSCIIPDDGTLQIGIGALGDAIAHSLFLRDRYTQTYKKLFQQLIEQSQTSCFSGSVPLFTAPFEKGLYANTEMLVEGLVFLREKNILRKKVYPLEGINTLLSHNIIEPMITQSLLNTLCQYDLISFPISKEQFQVVKRLGIIPSQYENDEIISSLSALETISRTEFGKPLQGGHYCHAGFFVGSQNFYHKLRNLDEPSLSGLDMSAISYVNHLYGDEHLKRDQRSNACFINTGMLLTLTGAAVSDGIADHQMVSGVGGQYNFVAQAHELRNARSIICIHSTRMKNSHLKSNIVWEFPHITIPRHLRDIVATEYGIADLRSASDRDVIVRILNITDSRFQSSLLSKAKKAGKVELNYTIPSTYRQNTPDKLNQILDQKEFAELLPIYPMGSDFLETERLAIHGLQELEHRFNNKLSLCRHIGRSLLKKREKNNFKDVLKLMGLSKAQTMKEKIIRFLIIMELEKLINSERPWLGSEMSL